MQWLNSAGTAFRNLCLAFYHLKLPFHHLKLSLHHLAMLFRLHCIFWSVDFRGNHYNCCHQRSDFKAYAPNSISAGAPPQTPLGRGGLQHSPDPLAGFKGPTSKGRERREGKKSGGERREGEGKRGEEM